MSIKEHHKREVADQRFYILLTMTKLAFFALVLDFHIGLLRADDTWRSVSISKARLNSSGDIPNTLIYTPYETVCAMTASRNSWAYLYCFDAGICRISNINVTTSDDLTIISDAVKCMMKHRNGCIFNNYLYSVGQHVEVDGIETPLCSLLWCNKDGKMSPNPPPNTFPRNCSVPYKQTAYGCFYTNGASRSFCDARKFCLSTGGDMWTNSHLSSFALFQEALVPSGCWSCFIGMYGIGNDTYWINGTVATSTYMAVKYSGSQNPPFAVAQCIGHTNANGPQSPKWQTGSCITAYRPTFCEKTLS